MTTKAHARCGDLLKKVAVVGLFATTVLGTGLGSAVAYSGPQPTMLPTGQCNNDPGFDASNDPRNTHCPHVSGHDRYESGFRHYGG